LAAEHVVGAAVLQGVLVQGCGAELLSVHSVLGVYGLFLVGVLVGAEFEAMLDRAGQGSTGFVDMIRMD